MDIDKLIKEHNDPLNEQLRLLRLETLNEGKDAVWLKKSGKLLVLDQDEEEVELLVGEDLSLSRPGGAGGCEGGACRL